LCETSQTLVQTAFQSPSLSVLVATRGSGSAGIAIKSIPPSKFIFAETIPEKGISAIMVFAFRSTMPENRAEPLKFPAG